MCTLLWLSVYGVQRFRFLSSKCLCFKGFKPHQLCEKKAPDACPQAAPRWLLSGTAAGPALKIGRRLQLIEFRRMGYRVQQSLSRFLYIIYRP